MKFLASSSILAAVAATQTFAGGLTPAAMEPVVAPVPVVTAPVLIPSDWTGFYAGAQAGAGTVTAETDTDSADVDFTAYGLHAGYNYDMGLFVVGAEAAYDYADLDFFDGDSSIFRMGARAGYDTGRFLPFATAGYSYLDTDIAGTDASGSGFYYGFGADYAVTDSVVAGVQLLRHQFNDFDDSGADVEADVAQLRVSYQF